MTDEELANAIVAAGVGFKQEFTQGPRYSMALNREYLDAPAFVRDWRVAGAMMEKCLPGMDPVLEAYNIWDDGEMALPRAISEACVKALEEDRE